MDRFMTGADLADVIKEVLAGKDVRCAVAYWGVGAESLLDQAAGAQPCIICDVTRGGTSPNTLRALGAPENDLVRHIPRLHAKVYISDRGAIIGSANASRNGVGLDGPPILMEAGIRLAPGSESFHQAVSWFDTQRKASQQVDDAALDLATKLFRPGRTSGSRSVRVGSLLDLIATDPDRFSDMSIVLVKSPTTQTGRDRVRQNVRDAHPSKDSDIAALRDEGIFIGWAQQDLDRWRRTFIELWMPNNRLRVFGRKVAYFDDAEGALMSSSLDWRSLRRVVGDDLPSQDEIARVDGETVRQLLEKHGNRLLTAQELAGEIV